MKSALSSDNDWVHRRVIEMLAERLGVGPSSVAATARFSDLGIDSLDLVELTMAFEDDFRMKEGDGRPERMDTVQDLIDYLRKL